MPHDGHHHDDHHRHHPIGHNGHSPVSQWQTPHLADHHAAHAGDEREPDLDLIETAFLDAFPRAPDPTSFLRLAGVPFVGRSDDGRTLHLLRVEANSTTDVGSLAPHLGGEGFRYDPLPARMTARRQTLAFIYTDGAETVRLRLSEAMGLTNLTSPR